VKLIAEPWDCGPGGYQVGGFPAGWAEWNDQFRDSVRDFWRGEAPAKAVTSKLCATPEAFNQHGRRPWASINFITAHDGFTLDDLVSYNGKHNEANGEDNRDGSDSNRSWNCGAEGPTDDAEVERLRRRQARNLLATLLLSQGTPMLLGGDELGRTQGGNNNAYCQDSELSWFDWALEDKGKDRIRFVQRLIALRHKYPILRRDRFLDGAYVDDLGVRDVTWINANGAEMQPQHWDDPSMRCFGMLLDGRAPTTGIRKAGKEATLLIVLNDHHDVVQFTLPEAADGEPWTLLVDTNLDGDTESRSFHKGDAYAVTGRSLLLFQLDAAGRNG